MRPNGAHRKGVRRLLPKTGGSFGGLENSGSHRRFRSEFDSELPEIWIDEPLQQHQPEELGITHQIAVPQATRLAQEAVQPLHSGLTHQCRCPLHLAGLEVERRAYGHEAA